MRNLSTFEQLGQAIIIPLQLIRSNRDSLRKAREGHVIYKTMTLEPRGVNRRDELQLMQRSSFLCIHFFYSPPSKVCVPNRNQDRANIIHFIFVFFIYFFYRSSCRKVRQLYKVPSPLNQPIFLVVCFTNNRRKPCSICLEIYFIQVKSDAR